MSANEPNKSAWEEDVQQNYFSSPQSPVSAFISGSNRSTVYDLVKAWVNGKIGKFTGAEVIAACPSGSRSAVLGALKRLTEENIITKCGSGRSTFYVRSDAIDKKTAI